MNNPQIIYTVVMENEDGGPLCASEDGQRKRLQQVVTLLEDKAPLWTVIDATVEYSEQVTVRL